MAARSVMREGAREGWLGPYRLLSDLSDPPLEDELRRLADDAGPGYVERYGLELAGEAAEAVVLFHDEGAYRQYEAIVPRLVGVGAEGHASLGIVSLYRGWRSRLDVALTLLHELGHLLNRRALGPALPSWLDEGLAEDFAHVAVVGQDELPNDRFRLRDGEGERLLGPLASLKLVVDASIQGRLEGLPALLGRDWASFATGSEAPLHYAHAELWVRFLFFDADERARRGWRAFLDGVRRGESVEPKALREHLGSRWEELDEAFRAWLLRAAEEAGIEPSAPPP